MHVYVVFAHPSKKSFNRAVLEAFVRGLGDAGHSCEIGDLYEMGFVSDMDLEQYDREVGLDPEAAIPSDVKIEQDKINRADALAFVYPLWWSDCPAKLKGWFDRVFTNGYAYFYGEDEERYTKIEIERAIVICSAGHSLDHLEETGMVESMKRVMLNDRLLGVGVKEARLEILGGMMPTDNTHRQENLERAYDLGKKL